MAERFNKVITAIGARGTGKTSWLIGDEKVPDLKPLVDIYLKHHKMKVLIIDTIDHPSYSKVPIMTPDKIKLWKHGMYRIYDSDIINNVLPEIEAHLKNALLICEDAYKWLKKTLPDNVAKFIIDSKQKNIDIIFLYHAWGWTPPDLFRICDHLEIFRTKDSFLSRKSYILPYINELKQIDVKFNKSKFLFDHYTIDI